MVIKIMFMENAGRWGELLIHFSCNVWVYWSTQQMVKHPLAELDKTHWGSWLQPLDRFTLFDLIKTLSLWSASTTNTNRLASISTIWNTCILYSWNSSSKRQNVGLTYVNERASYSGWSNVGRALANPIQYTHALTLGWGMLRCRHALPSETVLCGEM